LIAVEERAEVSVSTARRSENEKECTRMVLVEHRTPSFARVLQVVEQCVRTCAGAAQVGSKQLVDAAVNR
jgi:hypothetical protein